MRFCSNLSAVLSQKMGLPVVFYQYSRHCVKKQCTPCAARPPPRLCVHVPHPRKRTAHPKAALSGTAACGSACKADPHALLLRGRLLRAALKKGRAPQKRATAAAFPAGLSMPGPHVLQGLCGVTVLSAGALRALCIRAFHALPLKGKLFFPSKKPLPREKYAGPRYDEQENSLKKGGAPMAPA